MIKVLIGDDHAVVRKGLVHIVGGTNKMKVVEEAANGQEVMEKVRKGKCDVVVLDINMPGRDGLDVLGDLKREFPNLPVLILSTYPEEQFAVRALRAGADGYLTKTSAPEKLVEAIQMLYAGRKYISPNIAEQLVAKVRDKSDGPPHEALSNREFQVMRLLGMGRTIADVANELSVSTKTVNTYRTRILAKMDLKTTTEIAGYAIRNGLID